MHDRIHSEIASPARMRLASGQILIEFHEILQRSNNFSRDSRETSYRIRAHQPFPEAIVAAAVSHGGSGVRSGPGRARIPLSRFPGFAITVIGGLPVGLDPERSGAARTPRRLPPPSPLPAVTSRL